MKHFLGNIGEFMPEQTGKCRVHGCKNTWTCSGEQFLGKHGRHSHQRMCDSCHKIYQTLEDKEVPCSTPGCEGTRILNRFQQLEMQVQGTEKHPIGFCTACLEKQKTLGDVDVKCRVKTCQNTWKWKASERMAAGDKPPRRFCATCYQRYNSLKEIDVPCRVKGCTNTWRWERHAQLEHLAAGLSLEQPPKKMCPSCLELFNSLEEKEIPCSTQGCDKTWKWLRFDQLEYLLAQQRGESPTIPVKRCASCYAKFSEFKDKKVNCANPHCHHLVVLSRQKQFEQYVAESRGETPAPIYCGECKQKLATLTSQEIACQVPGCKHTKTISPEEQLEMLSRKSHGLQEIRCKECEDFLRTHSPIELTCPDCGVEFKWGTYEQLLAEKNQTEKPMHCSECTQKQLQAIRSETSSIIHHLMIKLPISGEWKKDRVIADLPPAINATLRQRAEKSDCRIVLFGDEFFATQSNLWLNHFEKEVFEILPQFKPCVINSSIKHSHSLRNLCRLERDVLPYQPSLVIVGSCLSDAEHEISEDDIAAFFDAMQRCDAPILVVIPPDAMGKDMQKMISARNKWLIAAGRHHCRVLDLQARLSMVFGKWYSEADGINEVGLQGISRLTANEMGNYFPVQQEESSSESDE